VAGPSHWPATRKWYALEDHTNAAATGLLGDPLAGTVAARVVEYEHIQRQTENLLGTQ
jgi:hypothetical protein